MDWLLDDRPVTGSFDLVSADVLPATVSAEVVPALGGSSPIIASVSASKS